MEVMQGNKKALNDAIKLAGNPSTETIKRLELIKIFGTIQEPSVIDYLLKNLGSDHSSACLLYTSPSPRDATLSRMPSSA